MAPIETTSRPARVLLAVILGVAALLRGLDLGDPWGSRGFKGAFGAFSAAPAAKAMAEDGLFAEGFLPYLSRVRLADGSYAVDWYAHHPAASLGVTAASIALFGPHEWAVRLPWLAASLWAVVAGYRLLREVWGGRVALFGAWFLAIVPMAASYGTVPWCDHALLALAAVLYRRYWLWLADGRGAHLALACAAVAAGGLLDWPMHLVVASVGAHAAALGLVRRFPWTRLLRLFVLPATSLATVLVHYVHVRAVLGAEALARDASGTLGMLLRYPDGPAVWARMQGEHLVRLLTLPFLALVVLGLARLAWRAARRAPGVGDGLAAAMVLPGCLYVALFPARSVNHEFFWELGLLGFAALVGRELDLGWRAVAARSTGLARASATALVLGLTGLCAWRVVEAWRAGRDDLPRVLARHPAVAEAIGDPEAVVLTAAGEGQLLGWYAAAPIVGPVTSPAVLDRHRADLLARIEPDRPVYLVMTASGFREQRALYEKLKAEGLPSRRGRVEPRNLPSLPFEVFRLR